MAVIKSVGRKYSSLMAITILPTISFILCWRDLPDAPEGTAGISMFLVPKVHVNEDGSLGGAQ